MTNVNVYLLFCFKQNSPNSDLVGSSIEDARQELELSDSSDVRRHLNHSDQLIALQTPQMKQVGTTTGDEPLPIPAVTGQTLLTF